MKTKTVTLSTGRVVKIRRPSAAGFRRVYGFFPAGELEGTVKEKPEEVMTRTAASDQIISVCAVEPRFWIDPRPEIEQGMEPKDAPEGWEHIDSLDYDENWELVGECVGLMYGDAVPLAKTGTSG